MSISKHEQQVLTAIENDLASTVPKTTAMLAMFALLTAGEEMPVREPIRRLFGMHSAPSAVTRGVGDAQSGRLHRAIPRLPRQWTWLVWLVACIGLFAWALAFTHGAGTSACRVIRTAACQQIPAPSGPGRTANGWK